MGIPPTNRPPSSTPSSSSSRGPERGDEKKEFRIGKKGSGEGQGDGGGGSMDDLKKKGEAITPIIEQAQASMKEFSEEVKMQQAQGVQAADAKAAVEKIGQLVLKMVADMQVGQVGGREFAQLTLARGEVPLCMENATLSLTMTQEGLHIQLMSMTPAQEAQTIALIDNNRDQLVKMVSNLQDKNIQVSKMQVGEHVIPLPPPTEVIRVEPLQQSQETQKEKGREQDQEESPAR